MTSHSDHKENWKGRKVLILGLGQYPKGSGISAAIFAAKKGADVIVTDQKTEEDLSDNVKTLRKFPNVQFHMGGHSLKDIEWAEMIFRNPRVRSTSPEMKLAMSLGIRVESDVSYFLQHCPARVVGITGTRGKSTTSALVAEILKASGKTVWLGGNILVSPLTFLHRIKSDDVVVLELSSWLLETTGHVGISPSVACITNVMRDHLNSYDGMEDYAEAKAQIFRHQTVEDTVILNGDDAYGKEWIKEAPGNVLQFTSTKKATSDAWIEDGWIMMREKDREQRIIARASLKVFGEHNERNALAAILSARSAGATVPGIKKALHAFSGLPYRQEVVAVKKGVTYVNDSTATTPDGVIAAVRAFAPRSNSIHLILGGADKELDFSELASELRHHETDIVVLPGSAFEKLTSALEREHIAFHPVKDLVEAFKVFSVQISRGDVILLSPGCASFGQFQNEFQRGDTFTKLAKIQ